MKRTVLTILALLAVPSLARADSFSAAFAGTGFGQTVTVTGGSVWAGQLRGTGPAGQFDDFISFCVDIHNYLEPTQTFKVKSTNDLTPDGGQIAWLVNTFFWSIGSNAAGAGLQLAIWNVLYDNDWTLDGGAFSASSSAPRTAASEFLAALRDNNRHSNAVFLDTRYGQDQVTVAEPATAVLFGAATLVAAIRRRRQAA